MPQYEFNAETGVASAAVALTDASPAQWDEVTPNAGTIAYSTTQAHRGTRSYAVTASAATACHLGKNPATVSHTQGVARWYCRFTGLPSSDRYIAIVRNSANNANSCIIRLGNTGIIEIRNNVEVATATASTALAIDTWYRFEWSVDNTGGGSTGASVFKAFTGDGLTAIAGIDLSTTAQTFGGSLGMWRVGAPAGAGTIALHYIDDAGFNTGTTLLGPSGEQATTNASAMAAMTGAGF